MESHYFCNMFLRKPLHILLAFFVLISQQGFAFRVHYCGDSIASVQLAGIAQSHSDEEGCCGEMEAYSNCCSTKTIALAKKASDYTLFQPAFSAVFVLPSPCFYLPTGFLLSSTPSAPVFSYYHWEPHAPSLFKLYSQYLLYDRF